MAHRQQREIPRGVADLEARVPARRRASRRSGRFSASPTWRARCAPWRRWRRRRWRRAPAASRPSTPCATTSTAATSRAASTSSPRKNGGLLRYDDMAAFRVEPEEPVSTTFHGYTVYKPGFWSQGPAMIEALNILEGFNLAAYAAQFGRLHPHPGGGAEAGLRRPRHLLRRPQVREDSGGAPAFEGVRSGAAQADRPRWRRSNSAPATSSRIRPSIRSYSQIARYKIPDALLAKDTTCVDAIDKDGVAISITPSGAWMPPVIAGDTGIPLTQRAQSFLLVPGHPNELAGGKRPRVTLSPTLVTGPGQHPDRAFHARRRQPGPVAAAGAALRHRCSA